MAKPKSDRRSAGRRSAALWRADAFLALAVISAVALVHLSTGFFAAFERRFYDAAITAHVPAPSARIAIIAIDDRSIANIGRWSWPRDVHARMIDLLSAAGAKTIVHTAFFFEPQTDRGLETIRKIGQLLDGQVNPAAAQALALATQAEVALNTDAQLAASMERAGNVLIPSFYELLPPQGRPERDLPPYAARSTVDELEGIATLARSGQQPIGVIGAAAAGIGHLNQLLDSDGTVRTEPLLVNYYQSGVPSIALLAALHSLNLKPSDIKLHEDAVDLPGLRIATDRHAVMRPLFYRSSATAPAFPVDSFYDVLSGQIPASKYAGKIVLIGATAAGVGTQFAIPGSPSTTPVETLAHITSSILQDQFVLQSAWGKGGALLIFIIVSAYLVAMLPRLSAISAALVTGVGLLAVLGLEFGLLAIQGIWVPLVVPAALLVVGHLALTTKRYVLTEAGKARSDQESAETNRMMGLALQGQGQLDMAFDRFRRVPMADALMDNLYNLGLDFERKRQFNKAQAVYEHMARFDRNYKDLRAKFKRARKLAEAVLIGGSQSEAHRTLLAGGDAVAKPMLGRYQIDKELGKGAMGVVYLGTDPKIGRTVAIKTLALGQEFDGADLVDARARFFREAETAGRLQHPHIVTIFDAGEEHDLAYIAMEFLKGRDLVSDCRPDALLPVSQVLSIAARVAEALHYAHGQNVVHRDIKPANIMFDPANDTVKVTDFGIARITDSSKTRTGIVLGTPSFMSPEHLAGKSVDGRSDLYSLGVTVFQMLTGAVPFRADSMTELMYKIAHDKAPDLRDMRRGMPVEIAAAVAMALQKRPEMRYQTGLEMAAALRKAMAASAGEPTTSVGSAPKTPSNGGEKNNPLHYDSARDAARTQALGPAPL